MDDCILPTSITVHTILSRIRVEGRVCELSPTRLLMLLAVPEMISIREGGRGLDSVRIVLHYGLSPADESGLTVMVTSAVVDNAPSPAVARSTYVPGAAKCALVTAWPLLTAIGPAESNVTLARPRSA